MLLIEWAELHIMKATTLPLSSVLIKIYNTPTFLLRV